MVKTKQKALFICPFPFFPADGGGRIRTLHYVQSLQEIFDLTIVLPEPVTQRHVDGLKELSKKYKIIQIPTEDHKLFSRIPILKSVYYFLHVLCNRYPIPSINTFYKTGAVQRLIQDDFACIQVEHSWWYHPELKKRRGKLIIDQQNYEAEYWHDLGTSIMLQGKTLEGMFYKYAARKIAQQEKEAIKEADLVLAVSDLERDIFQTKFGKKQTFTVMNSVDVKKYNDFLATYQAPIKPAKTINLVYVGSLNSPQTAEGAVHFIQNSFPELKKTGIHFILYLVGRDPMDELKRLAQEDKDIILTGYVDDVRPYIATADIYIVPLRFGSGTRIKIMEAMAMGLPIVSTKKGAEGLPVADCGIILCDDVTEFTKSIIKLADDDQKRKDFSKKNREFAQENFDWKKIFAKQALPLYERIGN